ncbi:hypothetical protein Agub_g14026 [Astrephomene gubernaculifera]|uniref:Galactokinase n=1 Tax=Astrephomene gubernaculifera TaxID=47775 RepID=A0AAD3E2E3_9CHLO|nr:hypothetical protein Agub_g14026 [Astrephomene gubernaculifera]
MAATTATATKEESAALSFKPSPTVPLYTDLGEVYSNAPDVAERYKQIATAFELAYGGAPEFYARAPGRVNLIGEHIDYEGYGVLPMAIQQDTVVAIRRVPGGDKLVVGNVEADKYPTQEFPADPAQPVDVANHSWANYFLSAYKGAFELLSSGGAGGAPEPCGLQAVVQGQVPTGSGLSSSAAIVCASMLAILACSGAVAPEGGLDKAQVAEAACKAERYVGVTSGGMDQAISMMGQQGVAMHVEFNPVRGVCVVLPPGATFVIANSLAVSNKAETAPKRKT